MPRPSARSSVADQCALVLARKRIDQVEADPVEMALRGFQRGKALGTRMRAAEEGERSIVEALQAKAERD